MTIPQFMGPDFAEVMRETENKALSGELAEWRGWWEYPGNNRRYMYRIYQPDFGPDGSVQGYYGFALDLTELKRAEEELADSERMYRTVLDNSPASIVQFDRERRFVYVNSAYCERVGLQREDIIGHTVAEVIGEEGAALTAPYAERALSGERAEWRTWQQYEKTGKFYMQRVYQPTFDSQGNVTGYLAFTQDLTQLMLAQSSLEEREARFRAIAEAVPMPIHIVNNADRMVVFANQISMDVMGTMPGTHALALEDQFVDPGTRHKFFAELAKERRVQGFEAEMLLHTGEVQWFLISAQVMQYDGASATLSAAFDITDRKRAEQALAYSEIQQRKVLENIPSGIVQLDNQRRYVYVNPAYCERIGVPADQILGRSTPEVIGQQASDEVSENAAKAFAGEQSEWQGWSTYSSGREIYAHRTYIPNIDSEGNVDGIFVFTHDLSDLKRAQSSLEEREARFRSIAEAVPLPIVIVGGPDGSVLFTNKLASDLMGVEAGDSADRMEAMFVDDDARDEFLSRVRNDGFVDGFEAESHAADGTTYWGIIWARQMTYGHGSALLTTAIDISQRKRAEAALKASEYQTRVILDNVPARVAYMSSDHRYIYANRGVSEAIGLPEADLIGRSVEEALGQESAKLLEPLGKRAMTGEHVEWEGWLNYPIAGDRFVKRIYQPVHMGDGDIEGYFAFIQDSTEQKLAEMELDRQQELLHQNEKMAALGSLLAGVAHELNNPLSVVVGRSLMLEEQVDDPAIANPIIRIRTSAERCARIVKTFLAMARQQTPVRESIELNEVISASIELVEYNLRTSGVKSDLNLDERLPAIIGDSDQLTQVFMNLFVNACQAMGSSEERRLEVSTRQDGKTDRIIMTVGDTGSGIAPENISRIFEPFFTTKPVGVGTGVGLSVCHGILTAHDATIEVQSEIGKGTHFRIEFPIPDELPKPHAKEAKPDRTVSSAAVLVVDDEQDVLEMLAEILTNAGHKVATASSGREAVTLLEQREFDLIASDIKMPDMDGRQLVQIIEDRFPSMQDRIILITGDVLGAEVETFASERGLQYLEKPFVPSEVRDIVGELVLKVRNRT